MQDLNLDHNLQQIYESIERGGFGSKANFLAEVKRRFPNDAKTLERAEKILRKLQSYGRFRKPRWIFKRRMIAVKAVNQIWQMDLCFLSEVSRSNTRVVLIVADTLSRFVFLKALKNKSAAETANALEKIMREAKTSPKAVFSDRGSEFLSKQMTDLLTRTKVQHWLAKGGFSAKAALAERKILQFKIMAFRYLSTNQGTIDRNALQKIANLMNNTKSRVFKNRFSPAQVYNDPETKGKLALKWRQEQESKELTKANYPKQFSFNLGDIVRVQIKRHARQFRKSYVGSFSKELFTISSRKAFNPHVYTVVDVNNRPIFERLYSLELFIVSRAFD